MLEEMVDQFERNLRDTGFLKGRGGKKGGADSNSGNRRLVAAVVGAGLYPSVCRVIRTPGTRSLSFKAGKVPGPH